MSSTTFKDIFQINLDASSAENIFAFYVGALLLLAYFLSITVSSLHIRSDSVVYPLSRPQAGTYFSEYIVKVKTSLKFGSSFDERGRLIIQLIGTFADSIPLHLKQGKGIEYFLERGSTNIFVYHSPYTLGDIQEITITMVNDAPHEIPYVEWRPSYIAVMQPETRLFWSTTNAKKLKCTEVIRETFECVSEKKEKYGILKALCLFDIWISMMHSPVRFGTYSNFVNVLMVFYVISGVLAIVLFFELGFRHKVLSFAPAVMVSGTTGMLLRILTAVFIVWVIELILEAIFRNTVPKSSAPKFSKFHGLVEPIEPVHGLNDFTIDYEWDQVWPLVPKKRVIVPFGTRHDGARNAFTIAPVYSYFNFWGLIGREEEREGNWFTRTINLCALPLPIALKWLSKEAWGLKEEKLIKQYLTDFQGPMCFFCCWLQDWPLHYVENPQQASLIFSQIICRDILSMIKLSNKTQRARFAQLCFHQWNGLICCLFLYAIKQNLELRNEPSSALVSFIHRNLKVFGKRSPREIQATWKKRQLHLKELQLASIQKKIEVDEVTSPVDINNKNRSAVQTKSKFPFSIIACLRQAMCRRSNFVLEPAPISHNDVLEVVECIEDQMFFEDFDRASLNFGGGSKKATQFPLHKSKGLPSYSVIGEGHSLMSEGQRYGPEHSSRRDRHCLPAKLITKQRDPSVDRDDLLEVKVDGKEEKDLVANFSSMSVADSDSLPGDIDSSDSDILTSVSVDSYYSGPHTNININAASTDDTNEDEEDSPLVMEKTKARREMTETRQDKAAAILASKNPAELQEQTTVGPDVQSTPISHFELVSLGVPFNAATASVVDPDKPHHYLRHRHEIIGYACKSKRCAAYVEIHKKVGHVSLEILKKIIQDLLHFALDSKSITDVAKLWKRKKMVNQVYEMMEKKAFMFENSEFYEKQATQKEGFFCNQLQTACMTMLEVLVDIVQVNKEESIASQLIMRRKKFGVRPKLIRRCLFCARKLENNSGNPMQGCDEIERLVKFFSKDTIYVAEREINIELKYKVTIQNYCAMMVNVAKKDVMNELEDPPMVLATKVTRAMIYKLLNDMLPKHTSFKDMTADELRRLGTRRERIQARNDPTAKSSRKETPAEKKRKQMVQTLLEDLGNRWRVNVKENELHYCTLLLAQCLVQERILGFSLYSGLVSEEHEEVLDNSRTRLAEVEKKAYTAILKVARKVLLPRLKKAIDSAQEFDVLFPKFRMEANYTLEVVNVVQTLAEPVFMKSCCFYVDDIVEVKMQEFRELASYMKHMEPSKDITTHMRLKMGKAKFKIDEPFVEQNARYNFSFSSPILRWGTVAIKGVPPMPPELKYEKEPLQFDQLLPQVMQVASKSEDYDKITTRILKARRKLKGYLDLNKVEKKRKLESHLGRVQANLIEQITLASQNISDTYTQETDFQREYHRDELFNVEFYATSKLQVPLCAAMGTILICILLLLTLGMMFFTTFKTSHMDLQDVKTWFISCCLAFVLHSVVFEPLKCVIYCILSVYVD